MQVLKSKKRVVYSQVRYVERDGIVAVEHSSFSDDVQVKQSITTKFVSRQSLSNRLTLKSFGSKHMIGMYFTKKCIKALSKVAAGTRDFWKMLPTNGNAIKQISHPQFDASNVIWFDNGTHTFVRLLEPDTIASISPYYFNYMRGGIHEGDWDVSAAYEHLKNHPWIVKLGVGNIPYYQDELAGLKFIEMSVLLPQDELNKLVVYAKARINHEYWQGIVRDSILAPHVKNIDPLDVKQFYRGDQRNGD